MDFVCWCCACCAVEEQRSCSALPPNLSIASISRRTKGGVVRLSRGVLCVAEQAARLDCFATLVPSPNKPLTDTGRPKSLCYLQASEAKQRGEITESEYFHHLFAHCTWAGEEHEDDEKYLDTGINWALQDADPLAYSISCWAKRMDPVDDATPFEDVFKAYRNGGVAEVEAALNALPKPDHVREFRKMLAMLALQERRADVLKMCLDAGGFSYESCFQDEANRLDPNKDPETDKVLEESDFRKIYPRKRWIPWEERGAKKEERDSGEESDGEDEDNDDWEVDIAAFDEGGEFEIDW